MVIKRCYSEESRALFCGRELGPLADNWAHERSLYFRYYSEENSFEQSIALHV